MSTPNQPRQHPPTDPHRDTRGAGHPAGDRHRDRSGDGPAGYAGAVEAALGHAGRGWHVFPLVPGQKRPAVTGWEARATLDPDRIRRAWSTPTQHGPYGIGIACGPSQLLVVDLDTPKPAGPGRPATPLAVEWQRPGVVDGADVLAVLADEHGKPAPFDTYTVATPSGGLHLYFTAPTSRTGATGQTGPTGGTGETGAADALDEGGPALGNTAGRLGPLVDTRGRGGYVVAPPTSLAGTPSAPAGTVAGEYVALDPAGAVATLPGWLYALLRACSAPPPVPEHRAVTVALTAPPRGNGSRGASGAERARRYVQAAVDQTLAVLLEATPGTRNRTLYGAAVSLGRLVAGGALDDAETRAALITAATTTGLDEREAAATVRSGLRAGARHPRTVTTTPTDRPTPTSPTSPSSPTPGAAA